MTAEKPPVFPAEMASSFKLLRKEQFLDLQGATATFWNYDWETVSAWRMTMNKDNRAALQGLLKNLTIAMDQVERMISAKGTKETLSRDAVLLYPHIFGAAQALDDLLSNILEKQGSAPWVHATPEEEA